MGAATAAVVSAVLADMQGSAEELTNEQKEARKNLVTTLVTGVAAAIGNAEAANTAALIEMENNSNVKNAVKAAINDAKDYLGTKAQQGGEKLANLLDKLEVQSMVERKEAIKAYLDAAGARGGLTEGEIVALGIIYASNEVLFPTSVLEAVPGVGKGISKTGTLIKAGASVTVVEKVAAVELKTNDLARKGVTNPEVPKLTPPTIPEGITQSQFGKNVVQWGRGPEDAANKVNSLTMENVLEMKNQGLNRPACPRHFRAY